MKKIVTVVGARPQFIKASVVSVVLKKYALKEVLVHTGQHYDSNMSRCFFDELGIAEPDYNLGIGSGSHAFQTGEMLKGIEKILQKEKADALLVYGDTNSTLAAALAASKIHIPVAHVEAGLRSFDKTMPEEVNRVLTDHVSDWLFCPTDTAVENLKHEGVCKGVHNVGDVMYDVALHYKQKALETSGVLDKLGLDESLYVLATIHRDFNTDDPDKLKNILQGLSESECPVVFPAHPRVRQRITTFGLENLVENSVISFIEPVGYLDMVALESQACLIITDSGGVQKEAFFHRVPCVTVRPSTEWVETVELGWNTLVDADVKSIVGVIGEAIRVNVCNTAIELAPYGDGDSSSKIVDILCS